MNNKKSKGGFLRQTGKHSAEWVNYEDITSEDVLENGGSFMDAMLVDMINYKQKQAEKEQEEKEAKKREKEKEKYAKGINADDYFKFVDFIRYSFIHHELWVEQRNLNDLIKKFNAGVFNDFNNWKHKNKVYKINEYKRFLKETGQEKNNDLKNKFKYYLHDYKKIKDIEYLTFWRDPQKWMNQEEYEKFYFTEFYNCYKYLKFNNEPINLSVWMFKHEWDLFTYFLDDFYNKEERTEHFNNFINSLGYINFYYYLPLFNNLKNKNLLNNKMNEWTKLILI